MVFNIIIPKKIICFIVILRGKNFGEKQKKTIA